MSAELAALVAAWIELDPDPEDRAALQTLLDAGDDEALTERWAPPLRFGTAGLRGPERAGPNGLNRATVRRATIGVLGWLTERAEPLERGVVVGRDARPGSERFNDEVVAVLLGAGCRVYELPGPLPTPFVPYCVRALGAAAGVMITASHNPRGDNGFKVYAGDGAQINWPDDGVVEERSGLRTGVTLGARASAAHYVVDDALLEVYRERVLGRFAPPGPSDLAITYTPMHGVGGAIMSELLTSAGYHNVVVVASQAQPDGTFPTLPFPNPEEPGALDEAVRTANAHGSALILANDPDADRLGAAVRDGEGWRVLSGDEIGWLLASSLLADADPGHDVVATTLVSSTMLAAMASAVGVPCVTTLTGFKWIVRADPARHLLFGYEEALGYAVDDAVRDKDGLSAGLALAGLANELAEGGTTLLDRLDELETRFGVHLTSQLAFRARDETELAALRGALDRFARHAPDNLGGVPVSGVVDLTRGDERLAPTPGLMLVLGNAGRVVIRPSGTEAKVKAYFEMTPAREGSLHGQRREAHASLACVQGDLAERLRLA